VNEKDTLAELKEQRKPEIDLLRRAAEEILAKNVLQPTEEVAGFLAMVGHNYSSELMVVGRATNGWHGGCHLSASNLEEFVDTALRHAVFYFGKEQSCPMRWVSDSWGRARARNLYEKMKLPNPNGAYSTTRSAFWRTIKGVTEALDIAKDDSWPSHLVWSNLYKIAPADHGNPLSRLRGAQVQACASLLKMELETYKPKRVIFLTGLNWANELWDKISGANEFTPQGGLMVDATGTFNLPTQRIRIVVAKHPDRKKKDEWVRSVLDAFKAAT